MGRHRLYPVVVERACEECAANMSLTGPYRSKQRFCGQRCANLNRGRLRVGKPTKASVGRVWVNTTRRDGTYSDSSLNHLPDPPFLPGVTVEQAIIATLRATFPQRLSEQHTFGIRVVDPHWRAVYRMATRTRRGGGFYQSIQKFPTHGASRRSA